jgi:hypothetical protein
MLTATLYAIMQLERLLISIYKVEQTINIDGTDSFHKQALKAAAVTQVTKSMDINYID